MVAESQKVFSHRLKSQKKNVPNHDSEHYPPKEKMLRAMIWHLFSGEMRQGEKNYDIKLPLSEAGLACRLLFCRSKLLRF